MVDSYISRLSSICKHCISSETRWIALIASAAFRHFAPLGKKKIFDVP